MPVSRPCVALWFACVLGLVACQSPPRPLEAVSFTRLVSPHFEMWTSASEARSRALILDLEQLRGAPGALPSLGQGAKIRILVFGDSRHFDAFRRSPFTSSIALATLRGPLVLLDGDARDAREALRHGVVHASFGATRAAGARPPAWYEEGVAELLAHLEFGPEGIALETAPAPVLRSLLYGAPISLRRVLGAGASRLGWSRGESQRFAARSWALAHLMTSREQGRLDPVFSELGEALEGARSGDPLTITPRLAAQFTRYSTRTEFAPLRWPRSAPVSSTIEVSASAALEAGAIIDEARRAFLEADSNGSDPRASDRPAAAQGLGDAPTEVAPTLDVARTIEGLEANAASDSERWTRIGDRWRALEGRDPGAAEGRAAAAYHRAIELDAGNLEATLGLALTMGSSFEDDLSAAMLLRRVRSEAPGVAQVEFALAERLARTGQRRLADRILEELAALPHIADVVDPERLGAALEENGAALAERELELWDSQLVLRTPRPDAELEQLAPWVEVTGAAGLGEAPLHDLVLLFDVSRPTLAPSGVDVNDNGVVGRATHIRDGLVGRPDIVSREPPTVTTTDRGDSILAAQRAVARRILRQLDATTTRAAVVGYGKRLYGIAPLGSPTAAETAIANFRDTLLAPASGSLHGGLVGAINLLRTDPTAGPRRVSVFVVAGARPSHPNARRAETRALEIALEMGRLGIPVHTFSVGRFSRRLDLLMQRLSQISGGTNTPVPDVFEVALPDLGPRLAGLDSISITNLSMGASARAQRVFADGSFDALVPLEPGENRIEVRTVLPGGETRTEVRKVHYRVPEEPTSLHRRRAAVLLWELRNRSIEVAARLEIAEAQARRSQGRSEGGVREVELTIEVAEEPTPTEEAEAESGEGGDVAAPPR